MGVVMVGGAVLHLLIFILMMVVVMVVMMVVLICVVVQVVMVVVIVQMVSLMHAVIQGGRLQALFHAVDQAIHGFCERHDLLGEWQRSLQQAAG